MARNCDQIATMPCGTARDGCPTRTGGMVVELTAEITALETQITQLVAKHAAPLLALFGVGPDSASAVLLAAGDNPQRLRSEAAFSMLCGVSPVEASSGKTVAIDSCREPRRVDRC
jgi:transposase